MVVSEPALDHEPSVVGVRVLQLCRERGWSLSELAARAHVSTSQLSLLTRGGIQYPRVSTMTRITGALGVPDRVLLGPAMHDGGGRAQDLRAFEGTVIVQVVKYRPADGELVETGDTVGIAASMLNGRQRLYAALIEGGGMGPHVLIGDRVLFDPDEPPSNGRMVLLSHSGASLAAWYVLNDEGASFRLSDGSWLPTHTVHLVGTIVYIMRTPPEYRAR